MNGTLYGRADGLHTDLARPEAKQFEEVLKPSAGRTQFDITLFTRLSAMATVRAMLTSGRPSVVNSHQDSTEGGKNLVLEVPAYTRPLSREGDYMLAELTVLYALFLFRIDVAMFAVHAIELLALHRQGAEHEG